MTPEITTIGEAVDVLANCPMTLDDMNGVVSGYSWFIAIVLARYELEMIDLTGNLDSGLI